MAFDEGVAETLRGWLEERGGATEKPMFGGRAFLLNGNMVCGAMRDVAIFRVGVAHQAEALAMAGTRPCQPAGRPMKGWAEADAAALGDARGPRLFEMAYGFTAALPPK